MESVIYDYNPNLIPPSSEPLQNLNFLADSMVGQYTRIADEPILCETDANCGFSLDMHHVMYPLLANQEEYKFVTLKDVLSRQKLEKYVPPERSEMTNQSTFPIGMLTGPQARQQDKTNETFFDNVTSHPVHDFRYNHWNPAESHTGEETPRPNTDQSFLTANDTLERNK